MIISMIVSVGRQLQLGKDNQLIWRLKRDLQFFKEVTKNHHIIMGRKTYESIGRLLPMRTTIIVSRQDHYVVEGALIAKSLPLAIEMAKSRGESEVFLVGGESIYREGLELCDKLMITHVDYDGEADCYFPRYDHLAWKKFDNFSWNKDQDNQYSFRVQTLIKER